MNSREIITKLDKQLNNYYQLLNILDSYKGTIFYQEISKKIIKENFNFKELICEIESNFKGD